MTGIVRDHVAAVFGLLDAVSGLDVYDAKVPLGADTPYVVLYADQGAATSERFNFASDRRSFVVQTTAVGGDPAEARWAAEKAQGALLDVVPTVSGRTCWPIYSEMSRPVERDPDVDPSAPLFYAVDVWRLTSIPG